MKVFKNLIVYISLIVVSFILGMNWNEFRLDENSKKLVGSWLLEDEDWGFSLYDDGTASSINSAALIYQKWNTKKDALCLTARSIGNHAQSVDEECLTYNIKGKQSKAQLILSRANEKNIYQRM